MSKERPSPDQLLQRVKASEQQEKRGKLKIYLGASPGVGKTHAMLEDALTKRRQGLDVVIGVVESHGRKEIESFLRYFEIIPRNSIHYRGTELLEFDIEAALKRNPGLILMDEMAHSNAPDSRHTKRWQDIKEILDRGIDVYTTLNVQHIESLNDIVAQITETRIQETVPDQMLELADTIELVDLPPEDLLKRLSEGKIYFPENAALAAKNFFRKGNLIALRELALRITAEQVEAQALLYRQGEGIQRIWPTREKILVCVGSGKESQKLIRAARRMAQSLQADWIAVHIDAPRLRLSETQRNAAIQNLRFAEQLGAQTKTLTGFDIVKEIMRFAREENVTQIMLWKNIRPRWQEFLFKNLANEIVRHSGEINVHIITPSLIDEAGGVRLQKPVPEKKASAWKIYFFSIIIVALATLINFFLAPFLATTNLVMVYLLGVIGVALFTQTGPSVLAAILSVLLFDFFFVPPILSFAVGDMQYFFTLVVMLIMALIISQLVILTRRQTDIARRIEHYSTALYTLSGQLASVRGSHKIAEVAARYVGELLDSSVSILLSEKNTLQIQGRYRAQQILSNKEQSIVQWVFDLRQKAGLGTDTLSFSEALYLPLIAHLEIMGVLRICPAKSQLFTPQQMHLLESCAQQIALALAADKKEKQVLFQNAKLNH